MAINKVDMRGPDRTMLHLSDGHMKVLDSVTGAGDDVPRAKG